MGIFYPKRFRWRLPPELARRRAWSRYGAAVAATLLAVAATVRLPDLQTNHFFLLLQLAVIFSAAVAGAGPAVLSTLLGGIVIAFTMLHPVQHGVGDVVRFVIFVVTSLLIAWLASEIEKRQRAQEALLESERRFTLAQRAAGTWAWELDLQSGLVHRSQDVSKLFKLAPGTIDNSFDGMLRLIHPDDRGLVRRKLQEAIAHGGEHEIEYRILLPGGEIRWLASRGQVTRAEDGTPQRAAGIVLDVTDRRLAEEALRRSEERYRAIAENASDIIVQIDEAGRMLFVNPAVERLLGYRPEQLLGQRVTALMPPEMRERFLLSLRQYLTEGTKHLPWHGYEVIALHRDGHEIPFEVSFSESRQNGTRHLTGIMRDISERKRGYEQSERLAAIVESSDDAIVSLTLDGVITTWNKGAERIFGYSAREALGLGTAAT